MIRYENVAVNRGGVDVLRGFDLEVARGEKVLIYGKSGMGKSTILKLLLGFTYPDSGSVHFDGMEIDRHTVWEVRKRTAYVSQDLDIGEGVVSDFIDTVFSHKTNRHLLDAREERLEGLMGMLELPQKILEKDFADISGGEKQRVALLLSMMLDREVYLLDEVTSAVDLELKRRLVEHFASTDGATVLAVSHDVNWLENENIRIVRLGRENGS